MKCKLIGCLLVLAIGASGVPAADIAKIQALVQQIQLLRAQEVISIQHIQTQYESLIRQDRRPEKELTAIRETLDKQEKDLLEVATTEEQRKAIQDRYNFLRNVLTNKIRLNPRQIAELRKEEKALIDHVKAAYDGQILTLQKAIKALEGPPSKNPRN